MDYRDRVLSCAECGAEFVFTAGEQLFYAGKGLKHQPRRCRNCRSRRHPTSAAASPSHAVTAAVCSRCGKETTVPFKLTQGRPVYCRECFQERRGASRAH